MVIECEWCEHGKNENSFTKDKIIGNCMSCNNGYFYPYGMKRKRYAKNVILIIKKFVVRHELLIDVILTKILIKLIMEDVKKLMFNILLKIWKIIC